MKAIIQILISALKTEKELIPIYNLIYLPKIKILPGLKNPLLKTCKLITEIKLNKLYLHIKLRNKDKIENILLLILYKEMKNKSKALI